MSKIIIFDFDGTIADTVEAMVELYNNIAEKFGCRVVKEDERVTLQSKKTRDIMKAVGVSPIKLPKLALQLKGELSNHIEEIKPIKGMVQALDDVKKAGYQMGIMTSNSVENVKKFLAVHQMGSDFDFIYSGSNIFGKDKVIKKLAKEQKINIDNCIYVGDETRDIEAVKRIKMPIISVSWGLNTRDILSKLEPDALIDSPEELLPCIQSLNKQ